MNRDEKAVIEAYEQAVRDVPLGVSLAFPALGNSQAVAVQFIMAVQGYSYHYQTVWSPVWRDRDDGTPYRRRLFWKTLKGAKEYWLRTCGWRQE